MNIFTFIPKSQLKKMKLENIKACYDNIDFNSTFQ